MLVLQFVTGSSRVPFGGFGAMVRSLEFPLPLHPLPEFSSPLSSLPQASGGNSMSFTIVRADDSTEKLPNASTCFNMLRLPEYESREQLRDRLLVSIRFGSEGFEFV